MKIISWNVNGIRAVRKKGFIEFVKLENPDVICLQEIKASATELDEYLKIHGYHTLASYADKKGYSGTAVISKKRVKLIADKIGFGQFDSEGRILACDFDDFVLVNLYLPHGGRAKEKLSYKLECYRKLISFLKKFNGRNIILTGDFNIAREEIDLARPKQNKNNIMFTAEERAVLESLIELGFADTFRIFNKEGGNYTWWPYFANARERNIGWRIDYIFAKRDQIYKIKKASILNKVLGSDHCPTLIEI